MNTKLKLLSGIVAITAAFSSVASAAPVVFFNNPGTLGTLDLTEGVISGSARGYPNGGDGVYSNAGGGDPVGAVENVILTAAGLDVDLILYGKSDDNPGLFNLTGFPGTDGTWDVIDDAIDIDYITVKAANSFALYDVQGANSGSWTTEGILNNGGSQPGVSHISFWTVDGSSTGPGPVGPGPVGPGPVGPGPVGPGPVGPGPSAVPEPSTYAMFGAAFLMLGIAGYRSRNRKS